MIKIGSKVRYITDAKNLTQHAGKTGKVYAADRKSGEIFVRIPGDVPIYLGAPRKDFKQVTR